MVDSNRIINYLKPRIKDIIYNSMSFTYNKPVFMLYINNNWVHHQYICDRFGYHDFYKVDQYIKKKYHINEESKRYS